VLIRAVAVVAIAVLLGTLSLRPSTLRAFAIDIGSGLADEDFRWLFLVHIHGAPLEHTALSDAADFVRETRGPRLDVSRSTGWQHGGQALR